MSDVLMLVVVAFFGKRPKKRLSLCRRLARYRSERFSAALGFQKVCHSISQWLASLAAPDVFQQETGGIQQRLSCAGQDLRSAGGVCPSPVVNHGSCPELSQLDFGPLVIDACVFPLLERLADASTLRGRCGYLPKGLSTDLDAPGS